MKRLYILIILGCFLSLKGLAQLNYGTTGLLHMPTADMQRSGTVMVGWGWLDKAATPSRWYYDTWNYFLNITFFPWLEVAYTCTAFDEWIVRGKYKIHMINQDRNFSARLRLWKEGDWKSWMPQVVVGVNDLTTGSGNDYTDFAVSGDGNGFFNRYYLAVTKHFHFLGRWGVHAAYLYNFRKKDKMNDPAFGIDYTPALPETNVFYRLLNGLTLMAEYDGRSGNVGGKYSIWDDHINLMVEFQEREHLSAGVHFKLYLERNSKKHPKE